METIILNAREQAHVDYTQRQVNALGYEIPITSLTTIVKKISEQKFYNVPFADFVPVVVGEGAWTQFLTTYLSYQLSDDFSTGVINTGANNGRLASGDAGVSAVNTPIINWAKAIGWTLFDLQLAAKSGNWELVTAKETTRKTNWDLGLQSIAFLGLAGTSTCNGMLTLPGITVDTTTLTAPISSLASTPTTLCAFIAAVLNKYRTNCFRTAWPTHFVLPESDYLGLATPSSADFPIKSILQLMLETFQTMTGNKDFKILPLSYADQLYSGLGVQKYTLLNYDEKSIRMNIPVDYTNTLANSIDNFSFQNAAYGQFTGVQALRPNEVYYMQF
jgi:hypothetical protein